MENPENNVEADKENVPVKKCGICGDLHYYRECEYVIIKNKILDTPVPPKAILTLPNILKITKLADETYSVFTKTLVDVGTEFGPFIAKKNLTLNPSAIFPVKIFNNNESDLTEYYLDSTDENECCWMMFVQPAADVGEQNLICYQEQDDIYFGAIKDIQPGEELKVWYSPYCALKMQKKLLTFKETTNLENNDTTEINDLDNLVKEQQKILPRAIWNCKFCFKLEKNVTDFAKHLINHYCSKNKKRCKYCMQMFSYKADYDKHIKIFHQESKPVNNQTIETTQENPILEPKKITIGGPLLLQCLDSLDNSNSLFPQIEFKQINLENLDNNLLFDDNLRLNLDMIGTEDYSDNHKIKDSEKEEYVCDICLRKFATEKLVSRHLRMHIGHYYCSSCKKVFGRSENLKHHKCNLTYSHKCPKCSKIFSQKKYLRKHLLVLHDQKYSCRHCRRKCFTSGELKNHYCLKNTNKTLNCPTCSKQFKNERSLKFHQRNIHSNVKNNFSMEYICSECSQGFCSKDNYDRHVKTVHNKTVNFDCKICDKIFHRADVLNKHLMEIHMAGPTEESECKFCQKSFKSKRYLDSHIKNVHTHKQKTKHTCKICHNKFTYTRNLLRHMRLVHGKNTKEEMHQCPSCPRKFKLLKSMKRHLKLQHPERLNRESQLKKEKEMHCPACTFKCKKKRMEVLQMHIKVHHPERYKKFCEEFNLEYEKNYQCPACQKKYNLRGSFLKHLKTHSDREPSSKKELIKPQEPKQYKCPICGHEVKLKSSLRRHLSQKHPKDYKNVWGKYNGGIVEKNVEEKDTNLPEDDFDNYMDLQKTIENMDFNLLCNDNLLSGSETIDKFLKESSDQISIFLADSPKATVPINISSETSTTIFNEQTSKSRTLGLSMPDLDLSEIELEPLVGRTTTPSATTSNNDVPDVVLYVLNEK